MKASCLVEFSENVEVMKADKYICEVFKKAEYYMSVDEYTRCFMLTDCKENEIKEGYHYLFYIIDGKLYDSTLTSSYEKLVKSYEKYIKSNLLAFEQLKMF